MKHGATCSITPEQKEERGFAWVLGSFALCPCHLPITLWAIGALLSGTALGALFRGHLFFAGAVVSVLWLAGTLHGLNLVRRARAETRVRSPQLRLFGGPELRGAEDEESVASCSEFDTASQSARVGDAALVQVAGRGSHTAMQRRTAG